MAWWAPYAGTDMIGIVECIVVRARWCDLKTVANIDQRGMCPACLHTNLSIFLAFNFQCKDKTSEGERERGIEMGTTLYRKMVYRLLSPYKIVQSRRQNFSFAHKMYWNLISSLIYTPHIAVKCEWSTVAAAVVKLPAEKQQTISNEFYLRKRELAPAQNDIPSLRGHELSTRSSNTTKNNFMHARLFITGAVD